MTQFTRDALLDSLLELDGQRIALDDLGHWVRFVATRVPATVHKPHGIDYSLTLHSPAGERLVGFDNAHPVKVPKRVALKTNDHRHRGATVKAYDYVDAGQLLVDFWKEVDSVMKEKGN